MDTNQDRIWRQPEVLATLSLSASAIRRAIQRGEFPAPIKLLGQRAKGWRESDIKRWLANLEPVDSAQLVKPELVNGPQLTKLEDQPQNQQLTTPEGPQLTETGGSQNERS